MKHYATTCVSKHAFIINQSTESIDGNGSFKNNHSSITLTSTIVHRVEMVGLYFSEWE